MKILSSNSTEHSNSILNCTIPKLRIFPPKIATTNCQQKFSIFMKLFWFLIRLIRHVDLVWFWPVKHVHTFFFPISFINLISFTFWVQEAHEYYEKPLFVETNLALLTHKHVCKTRPEIKEFICRELLQVQASGFTFSSTEPLKCRNRSFTVLLPTLRKPVQSELSIFACPQVLYKDLETNEQKAYRIPIKSQTPERMIRLYCSSKKIQKDLN